MKRRIAFFALLVMLFVILSMVSAQASKCPFCSCEEKLVTEWPSWECYYEYDEASHTLYSGCIYCAGCFELLDWCTQKESHHFLGDKSGYCISCGYQRQDRDAYQRQAWSVESDLDKRSGTAMYKGEVYDDADGSSRGFTLSIGKSYRVIAHKSVNGTLWVQICNGIDTDNPIGWVKVGNLSINTAVISSGGSELIGFHCRVKGEHSKNLRSGPGDYPVVGVFEKNKSYTIYDVQTGTDGKTWYKVSKDREEWVSAAVVEIY